MDVLGLLSEHAAQVHADACAYARHLDLWAQSISAQTLANEIGPRLHVLADEAFLCLLKIPDNLLSMLNSPDGWSTLAAFIAADIGVTPVDYSPTVH